MSRWMEANDSITVNFLYPYSYEDIRDLFAKEIPQRGKEEIITYLRNYKLPKSFCYAICKLATISEHTFCSNLTKKQRVDLVNILTRCEFTVDNLGGFNVAMATAGGIYLKEINPTTMESRKHNGLYFIGEVLDIDGDTGGYNIQAAFSTAHLCSKPVSYTHLRAHETVLELVCRLLLEKKKAKVATDNTTLLNTQIILIPSTP